MHIVEQTPLSPNPKQRIFYDNCNNPGYKVNGFMGGWGGGKTQAMVQMITDCAVVCPGNEIAVVRKFRKDIKKTIWKDFCALVNPHLVIGEPHETNLEIKMMSLMPGVASVIQFRGMDDKDRWGSTEFGHIFVDEANELDEEEFTGLRGRLRLHFRPNPQWPKDKVSPYIQFMAENDFPFISKRFKEVNGEFEVVLDVHRFVAAAWNPQEETHWLYSFFEEERNAHTSFVQCSSYDNWANLPEDYKEILETLDQATKNVYVYGRWGVTKKGKSVTPHFSLEKNVFDGPLPDYPITLFIGFDFGYTWPAVSFIEMRDGVPYKWREILAHRMNLIELLPLVFEIKDQFHPESEIRVWTDHYAAEAKVSQSETDNIQILKRHGLHGQHEASRPEDRGRLIDTLFKDGRFFIHDSCEKTKTAYMGGWYRDPKNQDRIDKSPMNPYHNIADSDGYALKGYFRNDVIVETKLQPTSLAPKPNWKLAYGG